MTQTARYEAPRIRIVSHPLAPGDELVRWLCEQRHLGYAYRVVPLFSQPSSELPHVQTPTGEARGLQAVLALFEGTWRKRESIFDANGSGLASAAFLDRLVTQLVEPTIALWLAQAGDSAVSTLLRAGGWSVGRSWFDPAQHHADEAIAKIRTVFDQVEAHLRQTGQPFLSGPQPGCADVLFAGLASPLILPAEGSATYPSLETLPSALQNVIRERREAPAGQLVQRIYSTARGQPQGVVSEPSYGPSFFESLLTPSRVRFAVKQLVAWLPRFTWGKTQVVADWAGVTEVLDRDNEFLIAPVNGQRIGDVCGRFILGMDRSPELIQQRQQVYAALREANHQLFLETLDHEIDRLLQTALQSGGQLEVVNGYARLVAGRTAAAIFGIYGPTEQDLLRVIRAIFHHTFLNLGDDAEVKQKGIEAGSELQGWIATEKERRAREGNIPDVLGRLIESSPSNDHPSISWMLAGLQVGAIDTTATAVANILTALLEDRVLYEHANQDRDHPQRLLGWCWEALRRRPHNGGLLREAGPGATLGGKPIAPGTRVLLLTVAAMHDPAAFPNPDQMIPDRPRDRYLHFGRGLHQCAGRDFNAIQIPRLVSALLRHRVSGSATPRTLGPFTDELKVTIQKP